MLLQAKNIDNLFLNTIKDLQTKIESNDAYEILMATALLRKLLVDANPLITEVNRTRRLKILFTVNDRPIPTNEMGLVYWSTQDGFDPDTARISQPITVNKDGLLKRPSMIIEGKVITVLDIIKFICHYQGAVHVGKQNPAEAKQELLKKVEETVTVGGLPGALRSVCAIGRVVLKGLEPLKQEVLKA